MTNLTTNDHLLAAREQMLAVVSHDIKNPISAIQLDAQMLLKLSERNSDSLLAKEIKIQASRILRTTERMKNLIGDLLDKSKTENTLASIHPVEIDIVSLIQEVLDSLRAITLEKRLNFDLNFPDHLYLFADRNKIFQVLSNLVNNAIKFSPVGGKIKIFYEEGDQLHSFVVEDEGPGMSENDSRYIFDKYWASPSSAECGTGLGLFICKTIVEAHGGKIFAQNLDRGARFVFHLPRKQNQERSLNFELWHSDARKKIFVVDDDDDLREVMCWAFEMENLLAFGFSCPLKALEALENSHLPQLIIVDLHMDKMNGSDFVLSKNKMIDVLDCPIILMTADPNGLDEGKIKNEVSEILTKPIDLEALVENVKRYTLQLN